MTFASLLDEANVQSLIGSRARKGLEIRSCAIEHVRYAPGVSCAVLYRVTVAGGSTDDEESLVYAKSYDEKGFAQARARLEGRGWTPGTLGLSPAFLPDYRAILLEFPNDDRLRSLPLAVDPQRMRALLGPQLDRIAGEGGWLEPSLRWQRLRYKPESRFVARGEITCHRGTIPLVLRFERPGRNEIVADTLLRLRRIFEAENTIAIPQPYFVDSTLDLIAIEFLEGEKLVQLLHSDCAEPALAATARSLARLHRHHDPELPVLPADSCLLDAERAARGLEHAGAAIVERAHRLLRELRLMGKNSRSGPAGFRHGDFHHGQVLYGDHRVCILDFESSSTGETAGDVSSFLAQLELLRLRNRVPRGASMGELFLATYEEAAGSRLAKDRLRLWMGVIFLKRAAKEFRRMRPDWPEKVSSILDLASERVEA